MDFNNYKPDYYGTPVFERYLYNVRYSAAPKNAIQAQNNGFSIEDILEQDNHRLLDKVVNTAFSITYRLKLYEESKRFFEDKWNEMSLAMGEIEGFKVGYNANVDRRKSMLLKERNLIDLKMLENKHETWKDLIEPTMMFVDLWHKKNETRQDAKILRG